MLVDEEDRRYFKQQEIVLWRKGEKTRKPFQASLQQQYKQMQNPNVQFTSSDSSLKSAAAVGAGKDHTNHKTRWFFFNAFKYLPANPQTKS